MEFHFQATLLKQVTISIICFADLRAYRALKETPFCKQEIVKNLLNLLFLRYFVCQLTF